MSTEQNGGNAAPRTLADDLRARDDGALAELLRTRPDLLSPVPNDLTQLATRAGTRASVVRAVERLDLFALQTAEAIAIAPDPCSYGILEALLAGHPENLDPPGDPACHVATELPGALRTLRSQALLWGDDDRLRLVRTVRELLTPSPSEGPGSAECAG
ncbi:MAG TPA: DNA-binding protein, partial [Streptomyces sp.]|nr:DNA-binding protein [Streptomyces sp.]